MLRTRRGGSRTAQHTPLMTNTEGWQRSRVQDWRGLQALSFDALVKKRHSRVYLEVLKQKLDTRFDLRNVTFQYIHALIQKLLPLLEAFKSPDIPHTGRKVGF